MYDGIFIVALLMTIVGGVIDLMSGNFARAATAAIILLILTGIGIRAVIKDNQLTKQRIEALKRWCPDKPEYWYRERIRLNFDGADIQYASQQKRIAKLKEHIPGKPDWWYRDAINREEYRNIL